MPIKNDREYRSMKLHPDDADDAEYRVTGYATTFDQPYILWEDDSTVFREAVDPAAFDGCDMSDVIMQYDHEGRVFARTRNNTLELQPDEHGLHVAADLSGTEAGRRLYDEIKGGYIDRMSFAFVVSGEDIDKRELESGKMLYTRRITAISKLYDVSAVSIPANDQTEISARAYCDGVIAAAEAERLRALRSHISKLRLKLKIGGF